MLHTHEVIGSSPIAPTIQSPDLPTTSADTENCFATLNRTASSLGDLGRLVGQFETRLDSLQLAPFEYDHLIYQSRGSHGERLAVGRYLIRDQGDVLVPFLRDECKNV